MPVAIKPSQPDTHTVSEPSANKIPVVSTTIATTCAYCGVGCGVMANITDEAMTVSGDLSHPANAGKLCSKGSALANTLDVDRRVREPMVDGNVVSYDTALTHVADKLSEYRQDFGADSIMLYVSGQLLTEDYYVANKFAKGFLGTNNIDSNSRLCMSSAVAGYKRAFGSDTVPCSYQDIEDSDLFVIIGSNMAWCHPILFGRLKQSKQTQPDKKVVVIDPRETDSCQIADLHLPIKGGTDTHLFNGLLHYLHQHGHADTGYLAYCEGVEDTIAACTNFTLEAVAAHCGVSVSDLSQFYQWFATTDKTVSFYSMGVNQSSSGTDKVNAIINAHLYTGKMGYAGAGAFSITGQPNAMGGREVGALANLLSSHFELKNPEHRQLVSEFWQSPVPISATDGVKAAEAAAAIAAGKIKAIWIMATNPVVSLTEGNAFARALEQCELVIVSDCSKDSDTLAYADVVLPAQGWSEKSGTVTNSERCVSRQRSLLPPLISTVTQERVKPDWWLVSQVAKRMGFSGFAYTHAYQIFVEHARLSGFANHQADTSNRQSVARSFDISHLSQISQTEYDALLPFQWGQSHYFGQAHLQQGQIYTASGKAKLLPITPTLPQSKVSADFPFVLNTGRLRDQWHTMTRTGMASQLNQHLPQPFVAMHPHDARTLGLQDKDIVQVSSVQGTALTRVQVSTRQRQGDVFMPMHWNDHFTYNARVGQLIKAHVDPVSQQPEFKYTPVNIKKYTALSDAADNTPAFAKLLVRHAEDDMVLTDLHSPLIEGKGNQHHGQITADYWVRNRQAFSTEFLLATMMSDTPSQGGVPTSDTVIDMARVKTSAWFSLDYWQPIMLAWFAQSQSVSIDNLQVIHYHDSARQDLRLAVTYTQGEDSHLLAVLFVNRQEDKLPNHAWIDGLFGEVLTPLTRKWLLAGRPASGFVDVGRIVCSCMTVGENTIIDTIKSQGCTTAAQVGQHCKAGTNCGSCISEINAIITEVTQKEQPTEI